MSIKSWILLTHRESLVVTMALAGRLFATENVPVNLLVRPFVEGEARHSGATRVGPIRQRFTVA